MAYFGRTQALASLDRRFCLALAYFGFGCTIVGDHGRFFRHVFDDFKVFDFWDGPREAREALGGAFWEGLGGS